MRKRILYPLGAISAGVILLASLGGLNAQQSAGEAISIESDDIGGVVTSTSGSGRLGHCRNSRPA